MGALIKHINVGFKITLIPELGSKHHLVCETRLDLSGCQFGASLRVLCKTLENIENEASQQHPVRQRGQ